MEADIHTHCANLFDPEWIVSGELALCLEDQPHISTWQNYQENADRAGKSVFQTLTQALVQWNFPIQDGISNQAAYQDVTRRFASPAECGLATGHEFEKPESIRLDIHDSIAGRIPVLIFATRHDFEYAWLALTNRNEPKDVLPSVGAAFISGYNNIDRINRYKADFLSHRDNSEWAAELRSLITRKEQYQDQFILISPGPYSNVAAVELGLTRDEWERLSIDIRVHHETAHYITRRLCGAGNTNLFDELLADYLGISAALGHYDANWFMRFLGFDANLNYQPGGRIEHYIGTLNITSGSFKLLAQLLRQAAENLQQADQILRNEQPRQRGRAQYDPTYTMLALTKMSIEELARENGVKALLSHVQEIL